MHCATMIVALHDTAGLSVAQYMFIVIQKVSQLFEPEVTYGTKYTN